VLEREIKLRFESAEAARQALVAIGASPFRPRRLQDDRLLDDAAASLQRRGCALRLRLDGTDSHLTFKGPVLPGVMKTREEFESVVESGDTLLRILAELGLTPRFRYQKYREEFRINGLASLLVALDETPVGIYVELEGQEADIEVAAARLGRAPADYVRASYRTLFLEFREAHHVSASDMLFQPL
jgi:adenylate cyclase, class 2